MFDLIHSVDSLKLAKALDKAARKNGKVQDILVQVNISREETKSGIEETEAVDLVTQVNGLKNVQVKGLMTMPPFFDQPGKARPFSDGWPGCGTGSSRAWHPRRAGMEELSMGMTGDFEVAIEEGATLVRIGTAIFGARR
jgi:pyridoxal phosphate enzyme (YggS family)